MAKFTGKDVAEATEKGLKSLGIDRKHADIKVLDEGRKGVMGLLAKDAEIEIIALSDDDLARRARRKKLSIIAIAVAGALLLMIITIATIFTKDDPKPSNQIAMPADSKTLEKLNYKTVVKQLKEAGFANVSTQEIDDLVTGWLESNGEVEKVLVGTKTDFDEGDTFNPKEKIVVSYHTFPKEKSSSQTSQTSETSETSEATTTSSQSSSESSSSTAPQEPLTINNSEALRRILSSNPGDLSSEITDFIKANAGRVIEFDGHVYYLTHHNNYKTRYDILINSGDFLGENVAPTSPNMRFTNIAGTAFKDLDGLSLGQNLHLKVNFLSYNETAQIIEMSLVSATPR